MPAHPDHPQVPAASARLVGPPPLLRERDGHEARVTNAELFFDLIYAFAVTQLSHHLLADLSWHGAAETLLLLFAVWLGWQYTCWVTNWLNPDALPIRLMLFGLMLLGLLMSAVLPEAFQGAAVAFVACYVAIQVGRTLYVLALLGPAHALTPNFRRILGWTSISAFFWIAGAVSEGSLRMGLWAVAVACEYVSPMFGYPLPGLGRSHTRDWTIEGGHLAERCQLFVIMALGESVLVTGGTIADAREWDALVMLATAVSFAGSVAMWWMYFDTSSADGSEVIVHSRDPGRIGARFHYVHIVIVAGIIVSAVADEIVIAHPGHAASVAQALVLLGGPALYLLGNAFYKHIVYGHLPRSHVAGIAVLALLSPLAASVPALALGMATTLLMIAVAVWEGAQRRRRPLLEIPA